MLTAVTSSASVFHSVRVLAWRYTASRGQGGVEMSSFEFTDPQIANDEVERPPPPIPHTYPHRHHLSGGASVVQMSDCTSSPDYASHAGKWQMRILLFGR
uniref:Uncharacterized protein n=1 Tax=Knipowitschia caucasica TaxID=637954 RepID=A0AAV2LG66_KNICA